ncbi:MAG TPA: glycerol-3-phosphate dehydrogenase, partial [Paracoccaceae bacterium]|nr:glycerol-3-phosphate dehydrogenase [Paracoccaceae bacterium]
ETGAERVERARAIVNAGGPWVEEVLRQRLVETTSDRIRLVRGSHIVVKRLFEHDRAYIFQTSDGRVLFAIPYEEDFTLIGTTDRDHQGDPSEAACTEEEAQYLLSMASEYFAKPVTQEDIVWTYSGVRPLYDDGAKSATAATRDYVLKVEAEGGAPLLNVFGGKITTYRRLSEAALERLRPFFAGLGRAWTAGAPLPGGNFPWDGAPALVAQLCAAHPFLSEAGARRLVRTYGTEAKTLLAGAGAEADLGRSFGAGLTEREVAWLVEREWARTAEDIVWRRTKLGLRLKPDEIAGLDDFLAQYRRSRAAAE